VATLDDLKQLIAMAPEPARAGLLTDAIAFAEACEKRAHSARTTGKIVALVFALSAVSASVYLVSHGHKAEALVPSLGPTILLASMFIGQPQGPSKAAIAGLIAAGVALLGIGVLIGWLLWRPG
jgi:hypothetical protein